MRLWHTKLISALPREHLVAQWRELSAIAGSIQTKGTPNHVLVNFVMNYDFDHFISYAYYIRQEMTARKYGACNFLLPENVSLQDSILEARASHPGRSLSGVENDRRRDGHSL